MRDCFAATSRRSTCRSSGREKARIELQPLVKSLYELCAMFLNLNIPVDNDDKFAHMQMAALG